MAELSDDDALRAAYAASMRASAARGHLDEDDFERLACNELEPGARERALEHVLRCAECAALYRVVSSVALEAPGFDRNAPVPARVVPQALPFWPHATAAALALVAFGYATGRVLAPATPPEPTVVVPQRRPERPQPPAPPEPQVNVPIFDLTADATRAGGALGQRLEWPAAAPLATFVIGLAAEKPRDEYGLRVRGEDGKVVLSAEGLKPTRFATLTLALPRRLLPAGRYVFELRAPGSEAEAPPLEQYRVQVR